MKSPSKYIDVILPLPLPKLFTYSVPDDMLNVELKGKRVVVQFGRKKIYTALVKTSHNNKPKEYETKDIVTVLDAIPIVNDFQFKFWDWIADYYMCTIGEVFKAALPSGLKLESETKVLYNPDFKDLDSLKPHEELLHKTLESKSVLSIKEINDLFEEKNPLLVIKSMLDINAVKVEEKLIEKYKPKLTTFIRLNKEYLPEEKMKHLFEILEKAPKQLELLLSYITLSSLLSDKNPIKVTKKQLTESIQNGQASCTALLKKEVLNCRADSS